MSAQQAPTPAETYEQYLGPAIFTPWSRVLLQHASPKPGERVLDLACGTGIVTRQVAPLLDPQGHVTGLDRSAEMLDVARSLPAPQGAAVDWREGDASALDLPPATFDLALCQQGLQFFPDRLAAIEGVRRALKDDGRAVFAVWKSLEHHEVFRALFEAEARHLGISVKELAVPFSLGDPDELRALFNDAGFGRVDVRERTMDVRFPQPERFIALTVLAGAAVIPELAQEDPAAREALVANVSRSASDTVTRFRRGDELVFPMTTNLAVAVA